jgi:hypothetical protein
MEIKAMPGKKRIQKYDKFGLQLTQVEMKLIVEGVAGLPELIVQTIHAAPANQLIMMTLDHWKELAGHIASEANDTGDKRHQKRLDTIFSKIQDLLETHFYEEPSLDTKQPLAEESVQLAEWAAEMLIGAEQLGIKTKPVARFPLHGARQSILMRLPTVPVNVQAKLAEDEPHLTVGEVGSVLIAVSEALMDATPLQQVALILIAKNLKECLEAELRA